MCVCETPEQAIDLVRQHLTVFLAHQMNHGIEEVELNTLLLMLNHNLEVCMSFGIECMNWQVMETWSFLRMNTSSRRNLASRIRISQFSGSSQQIPDGIK